MRKQKQKQSLEDLQDNTKRFNICFIGVPEGEKKECSAEKVFEAVPENVTNLMKDINLQFKKFSKPQI